MSIYLQLRDAGVMRALRHPALRGLPRLARGAFCAVYDKGDTVLKLTCDPVSYEFGAGFARPLGDHFPQLVDDFDCVGETRAGDPLYLFEVEKLQPIRRNTRREIKLAAGRLCESVDATWSKHRWSVRHSSSDSVASYRALQELAANEAFPNTVRDALSELALFAGNHGAIVDFHQENVMLRNDTIVLNDVVVGEEALGKFNRKRHPCGGW
ncbi:hypothetical protein [Massilia sp. TN1-12]|uniref:hypothetical protein n=1 Tax=Massilia paldalensis TaxID=3377675 RepID=UPI003851109E